MMFDLRLTVRVKKQGLLGPSIDFETTVIGSKAVVLLDPMHELECGMNLFYSITLPTGNGGEVIRLRCRGKVLVLTAFQSTVSVSIDRYEFVRETAATP